MTITTGIEVALVKRIKEFAGMSALVGGRVYPQNKKQLDSLPAITYRRVSSQAHHAMSRDAVVNTARFQFDVWAANYDSALTVRNLLKNCLSRWRQDGSGSNGNVTVQDTMFESDIDLYEDELDQQHISLDFTLHFVDL